MKNKIVVFYFIIIVFFVLLVLWKLKIDFKTPAFKFLTTQILDVPEAKVSTTSVLFVGDIMFSRGVDWSLENLKENKYADQNLIPLQYIASTTEKYDLTIGNLETPMVADGNYRRENRLVFNSNPKYLNNLKNAGFDILSLANNHGLDLGTKGLETTIKNINNSQLLQIGAGLNCGDGYIKEIKDIKLGFLAYSYTGFNDGKNTPHKLICDLNNIAKVKQDIKNLKSKTDAVLVYLHSGVEYEPKPRKNDIDLMRNLIEVGAIAVINTHPHTVRSVEKYKDGVIAYSLGNFVFDQTFGNTKNGLMLGLEIKKEKTSTSTRVYLDKIEEIKVKIKNLCCPQVVPQF